MSYRALKHLLGETSLERKCRFIFGGGILILTTASFYWYGSQSEKMVLEQNLITCRSMVNPIVLLHHWLKLETAVDFRPVIMSLFGDTAPEQMRFAKWKFIKPLTVDDPARRPDSDFEYAAIEAFQKGEGGDERSLPGDSAYQYVAAIRLSSTCVSCHSVLANAPRPVYMKEKDLFAALSITVPLDRTNKAIQTNRARLITMAVFTAVFGMVLSYVIVRYIIVKPVKHLKDVSDAVSAGNIDIRADIQTRDEFEELCHAFNRMLRNLVAMQEELRGLNRQLDRKVDELAQANMALFEVNRLKSDFLATMSHELRTPLNSIIGFSEVLTSNEKLSEKERRYAANIQSSGKMLLGLINDILDLAKIESGKMDLHLEEFSVLDVVEGLVTMARPIAEKKAIEIDVTIDPTVPVVYQDAGKIQQILYNLLSNAIKFTPEGGRVIVSADATDKDLMLSVEDTGVGIAAEDRERIFEKFRQGSSGLIGGENTLTRRYSGSGLGLSIVRELSRMLGGEVTLDSELGKGSTFTVRLPLRAQPGQQFRIPLSDDRIDLSKARKIDVQLLATSSMSE
jgi:two-component system, NarL family, sensor histidine kinase BarA